MLPKLEQSRFLPFPILMTVRETRVNDVATWGLIALFNVRTQSSF